jgi:hypothetical protein
MGFGVTDHVEARAREGLVWLESHRIEPFQCG